MTPERSFRITPVLGRLGSRSSGRGGVGTGVKALSVQLRLHDTFLQFLCTSEHFHNREAGVLFYFFVF